MPVTISISFCPGSTPLSTSAIWMRTTRFDEEKGGLLGEVGE